MNKIWQTIQYYTAFYTLAEPGTKQVIALVCFLAILLFATSCAATEYRTDCGNRSIVECL